MPRQVESEWSGARGTMAGIDPNRAFIPLNIAVLTVSDTRTLETDTSGGLLIDRLTAAGHVLAARAIVKDEVGPIREQVAAWVTESVYAW